MLSLTGRRLAPGLYALGGFAAGAISWASDQSQNFRVFTAAVHVLFRGGDLYTRNASEFFKYSPTFALLFAPFTAGPPWLMASVWGALNFFLAGLGIDRLIDDPRARRRAHVVAMAGIAIATDGDQSNLLVTGAVLLALAAWEEGRSMRAAQLLALATLVKLFPLAIAALLLLRPQRRLASIATFGAVLVVWILLPLVVVSPSTLLFEYQSWLGLLSRDHAHFGWSFMSAVREGFGVDWLPKTMQLFALAVQALPLLLGARFGTDREFRRTLVCALLCFSVLFNHRSEYATFVISAAAIAVWYASRRSSPVVTGLVILSILAPGPFFTEPEPGTHGVLAFLAAHRMFHPLRMLPLTALWLGMQGELLARFVEVRVRLRGDSHAP